MTSQAKINFEPNSPSAATWEKKKWRPISMSLITHLLLATFLIILGYSSGTQGSSDKVIRAGIVLTNLKQDKETEYLSPEDLPEDVEAKPASNPNAAESANTPPPLAAAAQSIDRPEFTGAEAVKTTELDANQMADVPNKGKLDS